LEDDGWESIQDAQNAAALRALFELIGHTQPLHHLLPSPHRELWLKWAVEEEEALAASDGAEDGGLKLQADSFIDSLLNTAKAKAKSATVKGDEGASDGNGKVVGEGGPLFIVVNRIRIQNEISYYCIRSNII
jgi:hypothetical protein